MKMIKRILFALSIPMTTLCIVDFDSAMRKNHPRYAHYFDRIKKDLNALKVYDKLARIYTKNIILLEHKIELKIPKIIHQIWLGSKVPEQYLQLMRTWQEHHPDWDYILWTDEMIEQLNLINKDLYDAAINYGERADIARYEILYRFGGLYVDTDFECIQPFDVFHYAFDLYTGIELPGMATFLGHTIILPNGLIGCKAGHPILKECITALRRPEPPTDIVKRTGALVFTQEFLAHANIHGTHDIALPALYFYPIDKQTKERMVIESCLRPYTYAIHHWAGSWILKESAFVPGIKIRTRQEGDILKFRIVDERKS